MEFTQTEAVLFAALTSCHPEFVTFLQNHPDALVSLYLECIHYICMWICRHVRLSSIIPRGCAMQVGCHTTTRVLLLLSLADIAVLQPSYRMECLTTVVQMAASQAEDADVITALVWDRL